MFDPSFKTITATQGSTHTLFNGTGTITIAAGYPRRVVLAGGTWDAQTYNGHAYKVNHNTWIKTGNQLFRVGQVLQNQTMVDVDRNLTATAGAAFQIIDAGIENIFSTLIENTDVAVAITIRADDGTTKSIAAQKSWTVGDDHNGIAPLLVDATGSVAQITNIK